MEQTLTLLNTIAYQKPNLKDKIENINFIMQAISYRLEKVDLEYSKFISEIQNIVNKFDGRARLNEEHFTNTNVQYSATQYGFIETPKILLYEFNALIISLISYLDNIIDLYITNNYKVHPLDKH